MPDTCNFVQTNTQVAMKLHNSSNDEKRKVTLDQIVTIEDLQRTKDELLSELKKILASQEQPQGKKWLRSTEVKELLKISTGKLFSLRKHGQLPYTQIGGLIYYSMDDIKNMLENNHPALIDSPKK